MRSRVAPAMKSLNTGNHSTAFGTQEVTFGQSLRTDVLLPVSATYLKGKDLGLFTNCRDKRGKVVTLGLGKYFLFYAEKSRLTPACFPPFRFGLWLVYF